MKQDSNKITIPTLTEFNVPGWIKAVVLKLQADAIFPEVLTESKVLQVLHKKDTGEDIVLNVQTLSALHVEQPQELPLEPVEIEVNFANEAAPTADEMKLFDNLSKIFKAKRTSTKDIANATMPKRVQEP